MNLGRFRVVGETSGSILVVCMANVCRSPLAELVLRDRFARAPELSVTSAGIDATGAQMCAAGHARREGVDWAAAAEAHRSHTVSATDLSGADLILTSCRTSRGALARLSPDSRHRTFTLREAAWLGRNYQPDAASTVTAVREYAEFLDTRRAFDGLPPEHVSRWARARSRGDVLSIPDGHNLGSRAHKQTLDSVESLTLEVAAQIARKPGLPKSAPV